MRLGSRPNCLIASRSERPLSSSAIEQRRVEGAGQRAAAEKRRAEPHAFLVGESDDLDGEWKPFPLEQLDERNGQHGAEHAVERTGVRYRIEMRADVEARRRGSGTVQTIRGGYTPRNVADGIDAHRHAERAPSTPPAPCARRASAWRETFA